MARVVYSNPIEKEIDAYIPGARTMLYTLVFPKSDWTKKQAEEWLRSKGYWGRGVFVDTKRSLRYELKDAHEYPQEDIITFRYADKPWRHGTKGQQIIPLWAIIKEQGGRMRRKRKKASVSEDIRKKMEKELEKALAKIGLAKNKVKVEAVVKTKTNKRKTSKKKTIKKSKKSAVRSRIKKKVRRKKKASVDAMVTYSREVKVTPEIYNYIVRNSSKKTVVLVDDVKERFGVKLSASTVNKIKRGEYSNKLIKKTNKGGVMVRKNPYTSSEMKRVWDVFKSMGGRSPKTQPALWRKAYNMAHRGGVSALVDYDYGIGADVDDLIAQAIIESGVLENPYLVEYGLAENPGIALMDKSGNLKPGVEQMFDYIFSVGVVPHTRIAEVLTALANRRPGRYGKRRKGHPTISANTVKKAIKAYIKMGIGGDFLSPKVPGGKKGRMLDNAAKSIGYKSLETYLGRAISAKKKQAEGILPAKYLEKGIKRRGAEWSGWREAWKSGFVPYKKGIEGFALRSHPKATGLAREHAVYYHPRGFGGGIVSGYDPKKVWEKFRALGGTSPKVQPDLWRRAVEELYPKGSLKGAGRTKYVKHTYRPRKAKVASYVPMEYYVEDLVYSSNPFIDALIELVSNVGVGIGSTKLMNVVDEKAMKKIPKIGENEAARKGLLGVVFYGVAKALELVAEKRMTGRAYDITEDVAKTIRVVSSLFAFSGIKVKEQPLVEIQSEVKSKVEGLVYNDTYDVYDYEKGLEALIVNEETASEVEALVNQSQGIEDFDKLEDGTIVAVEE